MIIMMKLAFHPVNTHWLRATLHSLISVTECDLPPSGRAMHAIADRSSLFFFALATMSHDRYLTKPKSDVSVVHMLF